MMSTQTLEANAAILAHELEELGFLTAREGASVAFVKVDYPDNGGASSVTLTSNPNVAFVSFNGEFAGTQGFSHMNDLAATLAERYDEGEL